MKDFLQETSRKWRNLQNNINRRLLRLELLRKLNRTLHSEGSSLLAKGDSEEASQIRKLEIKTEELVINPLEEDLIKLLTTNIFPSNPIASDSTLNIPIPDINRQDRKWEKALVLEALSKEWTVWSVNAHVKILQAEAFDKALYDKFFPHGIVLFAQSAKEDTPKNCWAGKWYLLLEPKIDLSRFSVDYLNGICSKAKWTKIK